MSNVVKWALLAAGAVMLIGLVMALPITQYANGTSFRASITGIVNFTGNTFMNAKGLINNFLTSSGRTCLNGIIVWLFGKMFVMNAIKITTQVYHFIFRG